MTTSRLLVAILAGVTAGGLVSASAASAAPGDLRRPVAHPQARVALRPLTIRRRSRAAVIVAAPAPTEVYTGPLHSWDDPRLYYWGPFRTGGDVSYGDERGNPITRGNAGLGMIAGYGPANGGYGGPHFDAVGGFHNGPGPDAKIDADYASGSLSRPDYGDIVPHYPSLKAQVAGLDTGVVPRTVSYVPDQDRVSGRRLVAEGRSRVVEAEAAKAAFAAPMRQEAPPEAAFANGGLGFAGLQIGDDEF